jgi:N-formylglutamate deformylase
MSVLCTSTPAFDLFEPADPAPVVVDSPHSGRSYPEDFAHVCPLTDLYGAEDMYVDEIFSRAPRVGAWLLCARFPRSYIDVNRAESDLDPLVLDGVFAASCDPDSRSAGGYGLIRRLARPGVPMYDRRLGQEEIRGRIGSYYVPYHEALGGLLDQAVTRFGSVWHFNAHSMPSPERGSGPDIVLGDRDGTSCGREIRETVREALIQKGYRVALNHPYKGVEILRRYGVPRKGRHSLQIELSKRLYMNEKTFEKTEGFARLQADMEALVALCASFAREICAPMAAD